MKTFDALTGFAVLLSILALPALGGCVDVSEPSATLRAVLMPSNDVETGGECPEGLVCKELCLTGNGGTEIRTGLLCCVDEDLEEGSDGVMTSQQAVDECMSNLRS